MIVVAVGVAVISAVYICGGLLVVKDTLVVSKL